MLLKKTANEMQSVLNPLVNAWRIRVLAALGRGDHSLIELGWSLELKTGHLQFHLRALVESGFVGLEWRRQSLLTNRKRGGGLDLYGGMVLKLGMPSPGVISYETTKIPF